MSGFVDAGVLSPKSNKRRRSHVQTRGIQIAIELDKLTGRKRSSEVIEVDSRTEQSDPKSMTNAAPVTAVPGRVAYCPGAPTSTAGASLPFRANPRTALTEAPNCEA